jgi:ribosomal protein S18 acetylase RimI-like enzyme
VAEKLRYKGYGTQLMLLAENLAKEKGCTFSTVNTMDWEALNFYKKLGYHVELERKGYCKNSIFYFLRKDF